jgi:cell division protein FtsN/nucleoid DNA-binding protein
MEKYILNLLKENSRVIVPEFGAFIIRQQNPPEIAFNSLLTFNDGILVEYVSHNAGIPYLEASAKITDYVEKLNAELKLHNRLSFNEIGWVWLDESGEKQFTPWKTGDQAQTETQKPLRDLETILKEAEADEKSGSAIISDSPGIQPDQETFILDDTIKEVDVDATEDNVQEKPEEGSKIKEDTGESFSLEESVISTSDITAEPDSETSTAPDSESSAEPGSETSAEPGSETSAEPDSETSDTPEPALSSEANLLIKPKTDLSESLQEVQQGKSLEETDDEVPKVGIRFKHEMPAEESVVAQMSEETIENDITATPGETKTDETIHEEPKKSLEEILQEIKSTSAPVQAKSKEKKKRSWIIPVTILVVLAIIIGGGWFLFPEQVSKIIHTEKQTHVEIQPGVEIGENTEASPSVTDEQGLQEALQETTQVPNETETTIQQETPSVQSGSEPPSKKYYVVAGRFRSELNAERYAAELRLKGFNAEFFGTNDNLYTVSFSSFSSKESAEIEMKRIRKSIEPNAWILYY